MITMHPIPDVHKLSPESKAMVIALENSRLAVKSVATFVGGPIWIARVMKI